MAVTAKPFVQPASAGARLALRASYCGTARIALEACQATGLRQESNIRTALAASSATGACVDPANTGMAARARQTDTTESSYKLYIPTGGAAAMLLRCRCT